MKRIALLAVLALSGCAFNVTLMPRDSGQTFTGEMQSSGAGAGSMTLRMGEQTCTGPVAKVASNEAFGFANTFGRNNRGGFGSSFSTIAVSGDMQLKAILSCNNGRGVRCDITGRDGSGGGICVDDAGRVYDALVIRK